MYNRKLENEPHFEDVKKEFGIPTYRELMKLCNTQIKQQNDNTDYSHYLEKVQNPDLSNRCPECPLRCTVYTCSNEQAYRHLKR